MKSTLISLIIGLVIIIALGVGGYLIIKKFSASADVVGQVNCDDADLNKDGKVNALDLNSLLNAISSQSENPKYDINKDGKVDSQDTNALMKCWTK